MANHLRTAKIAPAVVLCSPTTRTRQTIEAVLPDAAVEYEHDLYGADVDELVARLRRVPASVASVMVVAHNPGLHDLLEHLSGAEVEKYPTGALATLTVDDWATLDAGGARLEGIVRPRDLT